MCAQRPRAQKAREEGIKRDDRPIIELGTRTVQYDSGSLWINIPVTAARHLDIEGGDEIEVLLDAERGDIINRHETGGE